ncbi:MAG TPA: LuxR C-terminal-related transcriptional regulator, partial [Caldilineaceae bacterium]|nr:LuxR C-terminal-related transcriptional regulator [Caldilineaceae bacterium]
SPQPPPATTLVTALLNELMTVGENLILVLDDYHLLDSTPVDEALAFLLEHLPPKLHLVITTREDPPLPLARLRARAQVTEVRAVDLRFTAAEAADFLNRAMGLALSSAEVAALEARTEGWIAGLQLAAVSMQGHNTEQQERTAFIQSFTGSHRFVMDYLLEEVLHQQPPRVQNFLRNTSILDRFCGPLCDAVLGDDSRDGQRTIEALEQANLFIVPLDNERRWYRYHHLFGELLRQRLHQQIAAAEANHPTIAVLHIRASQWYEANGLELEAFHQATLAQDIARAERLIEGRGMPLHFRGAIRPVLKWLDTLPIAVFDAHPSLWLAHASTLLGTGQVARTEEALTAAERLLQAKEAAQGLDEHARDLIGRIVAIRATIAAGLQQTAVMIAESQRALRYLHPDNQAFRTSTNWKMGYAYHLGGDFAAASQAYHDAITKSQSSGNTIFTIMSHIGLGDIHLIEAQLILAAEHYRSAIALFGEQLLPSAGEAYSGLAQIYYEWNDLAAARHHAETGLQLARQWENSDSPVHNEWMLARVRLAEGDVTGAAVQLAQTVTFMEEAKFTRHLDEIVATQVLTLLAQGEIAAAGALAKEHDLPLSKARVLLAQGDPHTALSLLTAARQMVTTQQRTTQRLQTMVLQVVALNAAGETEQALQCLGETLVLTEPHGFIRLWLDEGPAMAHLLNVLQSRGTVGNGITCYIDKLLTAFAETTPLGSGTPPAPPNAQPLPEPLSDREIEVLQLIAIGHKNQEIADELVVSLNTVRYHTKNLYGKLGVNKRTQAVAKAQELGIL